MTNYGHTSTAVLLLLLTALPAQSSYASDIQGSIPVRKNQNEQWHHMAKIPMHKAIEIASAKFAGTPIEAELEMEADFLVYEIELCNGHTTEIVVDAGNGSILKNHREDAEGDDGADKDNQDNDEESTHPHPKISLSEALKTAMAAQPGTAIEAELKHNHHKYSIEIVNADGKKINVEIDANTGTINTNQEK